MILWGFESDLLYGMATLNAIKCKLDEIVVNSFACSLHS